MSSSETRIIDPRVKILGLVLITSAHGFSSDRSVLLLVSFTILFVFNNRKAFLRYLSVFVVTTLAISLLSLIAWTTTKSINFNSLLTNLLRWLSLAAFSLTMFSSINSLEFIVALKWYRIPVRIALALGISLRFFPLIIEDAKQIYYVYRLSYAQTNKWYSLLKKYIDFLWNFIPNILISVIRKSENILLSLIVQDIENRVINYKFTSLKFIDIKMVCIFTMITTLVVLLNIH